MRALAGLLCRETSLSHYCGRLSYAKVIRAHFWSCLREIINVQRSQKSLDSKDGLGGELRVTSVIMLFFTWRNLAGLLIQIIFTGFKEIGNIGGTSKFYYCSHFHTVNNYFHCTQLVAVGTAELETSSCIFLWTNEWRNSCVRQACVYLLRYCSCYSHLSSL